MNVLGLDTLGIILLVIALAIMLTYILWVGWKFQFEKRQFGFLLLFTILFGMFVEAWLRETGDELLIGLALFGLLFIVFILGVLKRRRRSRGAHTWL